MTKINLFGKEIKDGTKFKCTIEGEEAFVWPIVYNEKFKCWFIANDKEVGIKSADFDWADKSSPYHAYIELDDNWKIINTPFLDWFELDWPDYSSKHERKVASKKAKKGASEELLAHCEALEAQLEAKELEVEERKERLEKSFKEKEATIEASINKEVTERIKVNKQALQAKKRKALSLIETTAIVGKNEANTIGVCYETKQPALLVWPPGCGKNTILRDTFNALGREDVVTISITADMTKDSFLGHYILDWEKTVWQDWPLSTALKEGKVIIIDEMNFAHADILAILNNLTALNDWELGTITLADNGWQVITPHPDCRIFATANPSTWNAWTKEFNQATLSRFLTIGIDYLSSEDEEKLLLGKFPDLELDTIGDLVSKANKARKEKADKKLTVDISTRHLEKACLLYNKGLSLDFAIKCGIKNDCQFEEDLTIINKIF